MKRTLLLILALTLSLPAIAKAAGCTATEQDKLAVANALRTLYVAATADDLAKFHTIAAPDFYAFDGGKVFHGDELMALIQQAHKAGTVFVWKVIDPEVHATCDTAWITYTNRGSVTTSTGTQEITWLESATLEKQSGVWRIRFFHSTRAAH